VLVAWLAPALHAQSSAPAGAAAKPGRPRIVLVVDAETQEPIAGAEVTDLLTRNSMQTSNDGAVGLFVPDFVKADGAILRIRKLGYQPVGGLSLDPTVDSTVVVPLQRVVEKLPTVTTTATYRVDRDAGQRDGLAQRCQAVHATCITDEQLADRPADPLSVFVQRSGATAAGDDPEPKMHSTTGGMCKPTYYVDGFLWQGRFSEPPSTRGKNPRPSIDGAFRPGDVQTIEVYTATQARPMRFSGGDPSCGAIVVWTK
jgi:hypothetical protein